MTGGLTTTRKGADDTTEPGARRAGHRRGRRDGHPALPAMSPSTSPCCSGATRRTSSVTWSAASAPDAADDIVAETFLLAFRQRDPYDAARADARPWLYGIATHLIGRHRRAEIRLYRALARTGADPVTEPFTDRVDDRVSAGHASRQLAAALARLSAELRDTLLLAAWSDLSYEEIAAALGVPVGTVRSRLSRARGKLRQSLGDADRPPSPRSRSHERHKRWTCSPGSARRSRSASRRGRRNCSGPGSKIIRPNEWWSRPPPWDHAPPPAPAVAAGHRRRAGRGPGGRPCGGGPAVRYPPGADREAACRAGLRRRPGGPGGAGREVGLPADGHLPGPPPKDVPARLTQGIWSTADGSLSHRGGAWGFGPGSHAVQPAGLAAPRPGRAQ